MAKSLYDEISAKGHSVTQGLLFSPGTDRLRLESTATLQQIAAMLDQHPKLKLRIEGHTDNIGAEDANKVLSDKRAAAVKTALVEDYHVNAGRLTLGRMVDLMCAGPARVYGVVGKGRLAVGYDADVTLVDLQHQRVIEDRWIASPCGWTPFNGMHVTGWPVATVVRGNVVMRDDEVLGTPQGRLVRFRG